MISWGKGFGPVPSGGLDRRGPGALFKKSRSELTLFRLELGAVWVTLPPATSLVGLAEVKSSRNLTVKHISCQKSQFWVVCSGLTFSITSGHPGMNLPFDRFLPRWRPIKHYGFCKTVPCYLIYVCILPASLCQATLMPLESYLCQLHENRLCFMCLVPGTVGTVSDLYNEASSQSLILAWTF